MDAVFHLDKESRAEFLQLLMRSTGCTYICLRSYLHQANCLIGFDGCCNEEITPVGALPLFVEYRQLLFPLENDHGLVPGFAFMNNRPYIELREPELQNRASNQTQRQFYQVAGIKTGVFMGCRSGEIELGSSNVINMEMEMRNYFPEDFSRQLSPQPPSCTDPNMPSSSSSSLRSLSTGGSPDSSLIFTVPTTTSQPQLIPTDQATPILNDPHQQAMQALSQMRTNVQLPTLESENAAMTRAILAVLTSPSSSSSSASQPQPHINYHPQQQTQNLPNYNYQLNPKASAFKHYSSLLGGTPTTTPAARASLRAQSMLKQAILFYRKVRREQLLRTRPTSNQLQHMISERKRREKLNDSFTALRFLLPSSTKKDKASVLNSTREYLASLRAQIEELSRRNQLLEAQVLPSREATDHRELASGSISSNERLNVRITPAPESTSEQRIVDLRVSVRGERPIVDILIHLLEFLKRDRNVSLMSIEANTQITELGSVNHINLRLGIEGNGWDESTFQEAVKRLVADMAQ